MGKAIALRHCCQVEERLQYVCLHAAFAHNELAMEDAVTLVLQKPCVQ